jgi:predicted nuclease of predicted toxin-antitoxin system
MRLLANENFPLASVTRLRRAEHDVVAVIQDSPGAKDPQVLTRAAHEQRIILTFDRDYGELIYRLRQPSPFGVAYFRYDPAYPEEPAEHLLQLLTVFQLDLAHRFTVIERDRIRQRPLP